MIYCKSISISVCIYFLLQSHLMITGDQDFMQGNQLFASKNYVQACQAYQKIENKGFAVLYNIALTYLNQGKRAQAILYSKRAEKQANFTELTQLYDFLDYIHHQNNPDYSPSWYEQLAIFMKKCILSISMLLIQVLLLIAILVVMLCWYRRWYQINSKALLWIGLFYIVLVSIWWYKTNIMQQRVGVVTKNVISVFAGPDESFYKKSELHEADELIIMSSRQGYYHIKAQQTIGWISDNDIELV